MPLSWNEIKSRALTFAQEWQGEISEKAESQSFWNDFFNVFGISRRRVATFEESVKKLDNKQGFIDLFWKGVILIEHKSKGKNLDKAYQQAIDYFPNLQEHELPKYILVSDFERFRLSDLDNNSNHEFLLTEFVNNVHLFDFLAGYKKREYKEGDPVNIQAAELMGELHDRLEKVGYTGHELEVYLVRLLFCLFADDTGIFNKGIFQEYIDLHTKEDGSDLAMHLASIFHVLNQPTEKRLTNLDENLAQFPYVNGKLFEENLSPASFDNQMRQMLLKASALDWGKISPAIFGSMFQAVMNPQERRNLGAHYTSEKNIQKVIKPLFLDDLYTEFEKLKNNHSKLREFHKKLGNLKFLDPACGCGNFLIISYRELRELEILVLKELPNQGQLELDINNIIQVDVDQFYGIEYDEFPVTVAEVAMWLIDHQMNMKVSNEFGQYFVRLPLKKSANIIHGNALQIDWHSLLNPPQSPLNKVGDFAVNSPTLKEGLGVVKTRCAFVSTSSISQGEQVGILWQELYTKYQIKIHFAHRTFSWNNEAKSNAAVHCVIIGFANFDIPEKRLFDYLDIKGEATEKIVKNINPYLVEGNDLIILRKSQSISNVPNIKFGNQPIDGGNFIIETQEELDDFLKYSSSEKFIRRYIGSHEFINKVNRWCLWLENINPNEIRKNPKIYERIEKVKQFRLESTRKETRELALTPTKFAFISHNDTDYIIIPSVSSERRKYIPIGFMSKDVITSNLCLIIPNADLFLFGILTSQMHMTWVKYVCGRLKSDYRYSNTIVYNNYPFPENVTDKQREKVEKLAQQILDIRAKYTTPNPSLQGGEKEELQHNSTVTTLFQRGAGGVEKEASLADLYDPLTMPPDLMKAHQQLDKAVDLCYRSQPFTSELNRIEFLFNLYENLNNPLLKPEKKTTRKKRINRQNE